MNCLIKNILFGLLIITCFSCDSKETNSKLTYDVQIEYLSTPINDNRELKIDSIALCFAGNFSSDTTKIYINNELYNVSILTTDEIDGMAGLIFLPSYKTVESIGIRINNGKLIYIEPEKKHYNILLDFVNNKATVRFYRKLPGFM